MHMTLTMILTVILTISLGMAAVSAKKKTPRQYPPDCSPTGYHFDHFNVLFSPSATHTAQGIYFIHNISNKTVHMLQSRTGDEPFVMHINGRIEPNRWAVLSQDEKKTKYICANHSNKAKGKAVIPCNGTIEICEFKAVRFGDNHRGNYWLNTNNTMKGAMRRARYHGVLLVDPKRKRHANNAIHR